jgi:hypothetical protein
VEGDAKTEISRKPVPLPTFVVEELGAVAESACGAGSGIFGRGAIEPTSTQPRVKKMDNAVNH